MLGRKHELNIVGLILTDFLKLIGLAMIIAWPLFYLIDRILVADIFAYSAEFGFGFYVLVLNSQGL